MALTIKPATLAREAQFKRMGREEYRTWPVGHPVRYARSPVQPGLFVIWADAGYKWFLRVPAIQLQDFIKE